MAEQDDQAESGPNDNIKDLRKAADDGRAARAEADAAKRELAFVRAGVDTDTKIGKLFLKTYEGELTAEAIQTEARELGAIRDAEPERRDPEPDPNERRQSRERADLSSESGAPSANPANPYDEAYTAFADARKAGDRRENAAAAAFQKILEAAHRGDERVLVDPNPHR